MEKIVIGSQEISEIVAVPPDQSIRLEPKLPLPVPFWAKVAMSPLVFVLPILCLFTLVVRLAMRGLPPRTRIATTPFTLSEGESAGLTRSVPFGSWKESFI